MPLPLPTSARNRIDAAGAVGRVTAIQVRPGRRQTMTAADSWVLGDAEDHGRSDKRAVTLFQAEHLATISALLGRSVTFEATRRNLLITGLNLEVAVGRIIHVGTAELVLTVRCHPCRRMDEALGTGAFGAMFGHGGWCARVVRQERVTVGDLVRLGELEDCRVD